MSKPTRPQASVSRSDSRAQDHASILSTTKPRAPVGPGRPKRHKSVEFRVEQDKRDIRRVPLPQTTGPPRSGRGMAGILDLDRPSTRRDRTFVGAECAVCEEPLEHTLRGERILQLTCAHVAHEACFYEYIREFNAHNCPTCDAPLGLDSSRGGNVLDMGKLNNLVNSGSSSAEFKDDPRDGHEIAVQWDRGQGFGTTQPPHPTVHASSVNGDGELTSTRDFGGSPVSQRVHGRNHSSATAATPSSFQDSYAPTRRRHDHDAQSIETAMNGSPASSRAPSRAPPPAPNVTIKSEFPTLTRSPGQQSLTCLVTVEVPARTQPLKNAHPADSARSHVTSPSGYPSQTNGRQAVSSEKTRSRRLQELRERVDNWHGLDLARFGNMLLHASICVGKDRRTWQDLECYLFTDMLICVKEKRVSMIQADYEDTAPMSRYNLKGSILIKKHLSAVTESQDELTLTLTLTVRELPEFHLRFNDMTTFESWRRTLARITNPQYSLIEQADFDHASSSSHHEDLANSQTLRGLPSSGAPELTNPSKHVSNGFPDAHNGTPNLQMPQQIHVPLDIVVVVPVTSSMQGLKITLLRDTLRFLVANLGDRDRMGLVTFGASGGCVPLVGMTTKTWDGWPQALESIRPQGQKNPRSDVVEGANVAMDLLMQRKSLNPLSSILIISDSSTSSAESVDFVISRAEAAKVAIHSFGLGLTHKPEAIIELSTRTKASYTYVKDWNALRECTAGCLGALQSTSHQNAKLKLHLPEDSPAKFMKISGAMQITKRASGKDAEAALGNLRFGDKRDVLVQLTIETSTGIEQAPRDAWESLVSGLNALGGSDPEEQRISSMEEVPLIQADLAFGDLFRDGHIHRSPRPTLLTISILPASSGQPKSPGRPQTPTIPPYPSVVQRRMELLTSDMLTRALALVSKGQHERAYKLLSETRSILKGLSKGRLPPPPTIKTPPAATAAAAAPPSAASSPEKPAEPPTPEKPSAPTGNQAASSPRKGPVTPTTPPFSQNSGIDPATLSALDAELESSLEWINHPAVFGRDSRKAVLQAIGVISSQRAYTFRTPIESLWAERIPGVKRVSDTEKEWRDHGLDEALTEE